MTHPNPAITFGPLEGRHYIENAITRFMVPLAELILSRVPEVKAIKIWYDATDDFYRLSFEVGAHRFLVQYYKVLSLYINGQMFSTYRRHCGDDLVDRVRENIEGK